MLELLAVGCVLSFSDFARTLPLPLVAVPFELLEYFSSRFRVAKYYYDDELLFDCYCYYCINAELPDAELLLMLLAVDPVVA